MALASLREVQNQLLIARDVHYIDKLEFDALAQQTVVVSKLINGVIKSAVSYNTKA
jgi:four helix bundle protein